MSFLLRWGEPEHNGKTGKLPMKRWRWGEPERNGKTGKLPIIEGDTPPPFGTQYSGGI